MTWEFVFLGANIDAVQTAGHFGISPSRAVDYVPDAAGTAPNFQMMAQAVAEFRETSTISDEHFDEIRKDMQKRGRKR